MDESEFPSDFAVDGRIEDGTRTDDVLGLEFAIRDMGGTAGSAVRNLTREYLDEEWVHGNTEIHCVWNLDGAKRIDVI